MLISVITKYHICKSKRPVLSTRPDPRGAVVTSPTLLGPGLADPRGLSRLGEALLL